MARLTREDLGPGVRPTAAERERMASVAATERIRKQARQDLDRDHMRRDVRSSPAESSPGIRRMLGYSEPSRPPRRWEDRQGLDGMECVDLGPVDPAPPRQSGRARVG